MCSCHHHFDKYSVGCVLYCIYYLLMPHIYGPVGSEEAQQQQQQQLKIKEEES